MLITRPVLAWAEANCHKSQIYDSLLEKHPNCVVVARLYVQNRRHVVSTVSEIRSTNWEFWYDLAKSRAPLVA